MNPKYQIFISSTYKDLKDEREQVLKAILRLGHIPIGMELFNAGNETQWEMIKRRIEESDYYIVVVAHRYGSIEESSGLSYTEKEYDYATSLGVPTYAFVLKRDAMWPGDRRDPEVEKQVALKKFIDKVQGKMRGGWTNKDDLAADVSFALNEAFSALPRVGWVRADKTVSADTVNEMTRLSKENAELRERLEQSRQGAQNGAPMPELTLDVRAVHGTFEWRQARQNYTYGPMSSSEDYTENVKRRGLWFQIMVGNTGTPATDLNIRFECAYNLIDDTDVASMSLHVERRLKLRVSTGWLVMKELSGRWVFRGSFVSVRPGEMHQLHIPISQRIDFDAIENSTVLVDLSPVTGKHIRQVFRIQEGELAPI